MSQEHDDRRRDSREQLTLKVEYADAAQMVADYSENISQGGMFVLTNRVLAVGTDVRLVLSFPGLIKPMPIQGVVKWLRDEPESEKGVGVEFDAASSEAAAKLAAHMRRIADGDPELVARNLRILVVEDNPHVANLIRDGLLGGSRRELAGRVSFQFAVANNGRDALERLHEEPFDVLIIDIYLPVMDGAQVIQHLRADEQLKLMPVVAVSAGGASAREAALSAGADFFLEKPMRLADIVMTMRRLTGI